MCPAGEQEIELRQPMNTRSEGWRCRVGGKKKRRTERKTSGIMKLIKLVFLTWTLTNRWRVLVEERCEGTLQV